MMTAPELAALASQCYGQRWQSALARDLDVNVRTVQRWAADGIQRQSTADSVRRFLTERRVTTIPGPSSGLSEEERDDACHDALLSPVTALARAADDVGWHPAEVWVAILSIAVEQMIQMAGADATSEMLEQSLASIRDM